MILCLRLADGLSKAPLRDAVAGDPMAGRPQPIAPSRLVRRRDVWLLGCLIAGCLLTVTYLDALADGNGTAMENEIKAAFLYNIPKFVEWPAGSFSGNDDPVVIGVFGDSRFNDDLAMIVRNRKIGARSIEIKRINTPGDIKSVHLLFFGSDDEQRFRELRAMVQASPVLTVGEAPGFALDRGIVSCVLIDHKVRFEINMSSADRAGLKISAQLQKLASTIRRTH